MKYRIIGAVTHIIEETPATQTVGVLDEETGETRRALNYIELNGYVVAGDFVQINTVAQEMKLGTGGYDFIVSAMEYEAEPAGHLLKLRYTPMQTPVLAVEAPESPHHAQIQAFRSLDAAPVVCTGLHSQLPAVCAAAKWACRERSSGQDPRLVYIMTDEAALPIAFSRTVVSLKDAGLLDATITCGQAFGGDFEAINLHSALAAAKTVIEADIIIVGQGPGNAGTSTPLGFSGLGQGVAVNAAHSLGGLPILVPRLSFADARPRHRGLSEQTIAVLQKAVLAPTLIALPRLPMEQYGPLFVMLSGLATPVPHPIVSLDAAKGLDALLATGLNVTTMGRTVAQDTPYFLAAAAAGVAAAQCASLPSIPERF